MIKPESVDSKCWSQANDEAPKLHSRLKASACQSDEVEQKLKSKLNHNRWWPINEDLEFIYDPFGMIDGTFVMSGM